LATTISEERVATYCGFVAEKTVERVKRQSHILSRFHGSEFVPLLMSVVNTFRRPTWVNAGRADAVARIDESRIDFLIV